MKLCPHFRTKYIIINYFDQSTIHCVYFLRAFSPFFLFVIYLMIFQTIWYVIFFICLCFWPSLYDLLSNLRCLTIFIFLMPVHCYSFWIIFLSYFDENSSKISNKNFKVCCKKSTPFLNCKFFKSHLQPKMQITLFNMIMDFAPLVFIAHRMLSIIGDHTSRETHWNESRRIVHFSFSLILFSLLPSFAILGFFCIIPSRMHVRGVKPVGGTYVHVHIFLSCRTGLVRISRGILFIYIFIHLLALLLLLNSLCILWV